MDIKTSDAAEVGKRLRIYRWVLGFNMSLHIIVGLACLFFPYFVAWFYGLPDPIPDGWTRGWGATLILVTALYVPGLLDPLGCRAPNWIGIGGRIWMASVWVFAGGRYLQFAAFDFGFAALLGFLYWRLVRAADKGGS